MITSPILDLARALGVEQDPDVSQLIDAEAKSKVALEEMREFLVDRCRSTDELDIVAFGSLARHEWTDRSDFDYLVLVHDDVSAKKTRKALLAAEAAREHLEANEPGATGMFGVVASALDLLGRIGLQEDTNESLTRRILLLEESVSLLNQTKHNKLVDRIVQRYLVEYDERPKKGVPRLLLNDTIRYWRTLAVDYQAKNWRRPSETGWGLRYLKLRTTRKLCFASMFAVLLLPTLEQEPVTSEFLSPKFQIPALGRFIFLLPHLSDDGKERMQEVLRIAGRFNGRLASDEFRRNASSIPSNTPIALASEDFQQASNDASQLQELLTYIFFRDNETIRQASEKYALL